MNTGENKDTPQKSTCTGHFGIAKFVETKTIIIWSRFGHFWAFFGPEFWKNRLLAQNNTFMSTSSFARVPSMKPFKPCMYVKLSEMKYLKLGLSVCVNSSKNKLGLQVDQGHGHECLW